MFYTVRNVSVRQVLTRRNETYKEEEVGEKHTSRVIRVHARASCIISVSFMYKCVAISVRKSWLDLASMLQIRCARVCATLTCCSVLAGKRNSVDENLNFFK